MTDIITKLRDACVGRPAEIAWPHRLLHDAADEIERLRKILDSSRKTMALSQRLHPDGTDWSHMIAAIDAKLANAAQTRKGPMPSPTEKIYFNFSVEVWTADEEQIVEVLARCDNTDIAQAAFKAACEIRPRDCVLLRNGIRVVDRRPAQ